MAARDPGGDGGLARAGRPTDPQDLPEQLHPEFVHNIDAVGRRP
jgi:hypothetical protein